MSYDVAFWSRKPDCKYDDYAIYCRLRRGLKVDGLKAPAARTVRRIIRQIVPGAEEAGGGFEGVVGDTHVDVQVRDGAVLVDLRPLDPEVLATFKTAMWEVGLENFDPQTYKQCNDDRERLYDADYEETSGDPDVPYWVDVDPSGTTQHVFADYAVAGAQHVNGVEYVFLRVAPPMGVFQVFTAIQEGRSSIKFDRMNDGLLDGDAEVVVIVHIPASIVAAVAAGQNAREHVRAFTAFGDEDKVIYYQNWRPNDAGAVATIIGLKSMPTRLKTVLTTKYAFKG